MIEIRIVEREGCRPEFQYRYKNKLPPGCIPDQFWKEWSDWITAERVKAEDIEND